MSLYKERNKLKAVLALCFSQTAETYHHWRVFSSGPSGVCIVFDREALLKSLQKVKGISTGSMRYLTLERATARGLKIHELPFVKRLGFKPEKEFRVMYTSLTAEYLSYDVPIEIGCIRSVALSPWMHSSLAASTKAAICDIEDCAKLKVSPSTLISNETWKALGKSAI
jgi:hypothetical protein